MRPAAVVMVALGLVFTSLAGASTGSFPPPGKIVYRAAIPEFGSERHSLFTARTDGTDVQQITNGGPRFDTDARWSPDGRQVAFTRVDPDGVLSAVWVVNAEGTDAHSISGEPLYAEFPKWSPDGRWIAYQEQTDRGTGGGRADTSYDLWIVRPDGSGGRKLASGGTAGDSMDFIGQGSAWTWSSDSRQIAFVYEDTSRGTYDNYLMATAVVDISTGRRRFLTTGLYPAWSPDGKQIAVVDRCRLWLVPAKGGKRTALTPRSKNRCDSDPAWSPDGQWIGSTATITTNQKEEWLAFYTTSPNGKRRSREALPIRPGSVRWPSNCGRLFFYRSPLIETWSDPSSNTTDSAGWIVHGPKGSPRFAVLPTRKDADWHC